jgi:hypothetical protein
VVSPPRSQLRRKARYTALALASAVFLLLPQASPSWAGVTDDTPPIVSYSIDGIAGTNKWYRGSTHGNFIVVHWSVSDPESPSSRPLVATRPSDPGAEHGNHQDLQRNQ